MKILLFFLIFNVYSQDPEEEPKNYEPDESKESLPSEPAGEPQNPAESLPEDFSESE